MKKKLLGGLLCLASAGAMAASAQDIKGLMDQGRPREAYEAGKQSPELLGNAMFDFYFGVAAIDAGAPGEGVLALERYLLQFPDNRSARFHLARGYYVLGEDQRAREEFNSLLPDAEVRERDAITQFLDAIRARESRYTPTATAFVEAGLGYDSNINGGVKSGQVGGLPTGVVVSPSQSSVKEGDWFQTLAGGVQGIYPVAPGVALYGGAGFNGRWHAGDKNDVFDQRLLTAQGGMSVLQGRSLFRLGGELAGFNINTKDYLSIGTLVGEWQYQNDQYNRFGLAAQWSRLTYENIDVYLDKAKTQRQPSGANLRDSELSNLTATWTHTLVHAWNPVFNVALNVGHESNRKDRPDLSRDIRGARFGVTVQPIPKWSFGAGLAYQNNHYRRNFATALPKRNDDFVSLDLSAAYAIDRNWSVRTEYQHVDQQSSIGFYKYDRDVLAVKLRYDFK